MWKNLIFTCSFSLFKFFFIFLIISVINVSEFNWQQKKLIINWINRPSDIFGLRWMLMARITNHNYYVENGLCFFKLVSFCLPIKFCQLNIVLINDFTWNLKPSSFNVHHHFDHKPVGNVWLKMILLPRFNLPNDNWWKWFVLP